MERLYVRNNLIPRNFGFGFDEGDLGFITIRGTYLTMRKIEKGTRRLSYSQQLTSADFQRCFEELKIDNGEVE